MSKILRAVHAYLSDVLKRLPTHKATQIEGYCNTAGNPIKIKKWLWGSADAYSFTTY
ncbi:Uncharacterised protein [Acinetobacter lwoffii]|uniref:Uncharacterized protein n=1 Tax=Acinetobacter lwoffii NCTC 5866 = CIP 64.10 = NIPH 512 TaxID=981327 RepID=A0ABN0PVR7_ACILW|nr:hypothetical protein F995_03105 [Acinetobacter sp. CIP A162]ESJ94552.1 hypothetical protein P800_02645 [Acinetobacter lwoffii NCTC 5866 = CIP 64.10 = NIPH 512]GEA63720.1 hypothetical protein AL1T_09980 [Acinetobacter lwoffii]SUU34090.1 Uncharacterised protein [Acinetobacter lwoffii]VFQ35584.1 Uncharacterised protein [Acinetobacter lwoffii]